MPTEILLPDCFLECYQYLYPRIDFTQIHFYDGIPFPWSLGPEYGITLTWGFGSGIHIYMKSGQWTPCDQEGQGLQAFLIFAHELVHVLQIMNLPDPALWLPSYLGHFLSSGFSYDCSNNVEREAYEHANGCPPGYSNGALQICIFKWNMENLSPCDCSQPPILKFQMFQQPDGEMSFLQMLQAQCRGLVMETASEFYPYTFTPLSWLGLIGVDILAIPLSSALGTVMGAIGAGLAIVAVVLMLQISPWLIPAIIIAAPIIIIAALAGWLVLGLLGSLINGIINGISGLFGGGPSKRLVKAYVGPDGSGGLNLGGFKINSAPFVGSDGFVYIRDTDNLVWKVNSTTGSGTKLGGFKSNSTPFAAGDGFVYFQGTDNTLWKVNSASGSGSKVGTYKTKSMPFVPGDGFIYFQGTDNKLWKVATDGSSGVNLGGFKTNSSPFVAGDGFVYFPGTDKFLRKVNSTNGSGSELGSGWEAASTPFVPGDGSVYFQGADKKLWKVPTTGSGGANLGGFKTASAPFVGADGFVYFEGTDNTLWKVDAVSGNGKRIAGFKTNSSAMVPGDGFAYFQAD
jgi:hypothetical protein